MKWIITMALAWAVLFLGACGLQPSLPPSSERNVNLIGSLYVVDTGSSLSLKQLYRDTNQYVTDDLPVFLIDKMQALCEQKFGPDSEYVGDVRDLDSLILLPICASSVPFSPMLPVEMCFKLDALGEKWALLWIEGARFACKIAGASKVMT